MCCGHLQRFRGRAKLYDVQGGQLQFGWCVYLFDVFCGQIQRFDGRIDLFVVQCGQLQFCWCGYVYGVCCRHVQFSECGQMYDV